MKKYIVLNWKMSPPSLKEAEELFQILKEKKSNFRIIVVPPFVYLLKAKEHLKGNYFIGAQDVFWQNRASATGEISPKMLKLLKVKYVIVGHSERRKYYQESFKLVNLKIKACLLNNLVPILCVGEEERKDNETANSFRIKKILFDQLNQSLKGVNLKKIQSLIIAYEPVWAIGTGKPETLKGAEEAVSLIRFWLLRRFDNKIAKSIPLLYGGSLKGKKYQRIFKF